MSNRTNNQSFIYLLASFFKENEIQVQHAEDDADLLIVNSAFQIAETKDTILVGEDNDLLALLCHYTEPGGKKLLFKTSKHTWDMIETKKAMCGLDTCALFLYSFFGCDKTSQLISFPKDRVFNDAALLKVCQEVSPLFYQPNTNKEVISAADEKVLLTLYKRKGVNNLNTLRHKVFMEKVAGKKCVKPEHLPPTKDAAVQHFYRGYYQIQSWLGVDCLDPTRWDGKLLTINYFL